AIVAHHMGMQVFGMSIITDLGVPGKIVEVSHEEVQEIGNAQQPKMTLIMTKLIQSL
ncbi:MAG: purine-nucleoside phosphorylase, partial [Paludibacteraceae bacterium]|nr:purine-nucleoside phosphorylase [Paludibacteraceae bacterium]